MREGRRRLRARTISCSISNSPSDMTAESALPSVPVCSSAGCASGIKELVCSAQNNHPNAPIDKLKNVLHRSVARGKSDSCSVSCSSTDILHGRAGSPGIQYPRQHTWHKAASGKDSCSCRDEARSQLLCSVHLSQVAPEGIVGCDVHEHPAYGGENRLLRVVQQDAQHLVNTL
jgi:hypothetical protein